MTHLANAFTRERTYFKGTIRTVECRIKQRPKSSLLFSTSHPPGKISTPRSSNASAAATASMKSDASPSITQEAHIVQNNKSATEVPLPSRTQLRAHYISNGLPMVGFGLMDQTGKKKKLKMKFLMIPSWRHDHSILLLIQSLTIRTFHNKTKSHDPSRKCHRLHPGCHIWPIHSIRCSRWRTHLQRLWDHFRWDP